MKTKKIKFEEFETLFKPTRVPDNCVTFMCNNGGCPDKKSIFNNFEAISESPKKTSDYEGAQELLYMFYKTVKKTQRSSVAVMN